MHRAGAGRWTRRTTARADRTRAAYCGPRPQTHGKGDGERGSTFLNEVTAEARQQYPYDGQDIANTNEVNLLINGKNSVLDIKKMVDAQSRTTSDLQAIVNYIEVLKLAGLVEM